MTELMSNGERSAEAVVLTDTTAPVWVTHCPQLRKAYKKNIITHNIISTITTAMVMIKQFRVKADPEQLTVSKDNTR